jgi:hypothetical protein
MRTSKTAQILAVRAADAARNKNAAVQNNSLETFLEACIYLNCAVQQSKPITVI